MALRTAATVPARAGEPVSARTRRGSAIPVTSVPTQETSWPPHSSMKSRFRSRGRGAVTRLLLTWGIVHTPPARRPPSLLLLHRILRHSICDLQPCDAVRAVHIREDSAGTAAG